MPVRSTPWASGMGVTLVEVQDTDRAALLADTGIRQALLDGLDRGLSGDPPEIPSTASVFALREGRRTTGPADGIVALARDLPTPGEASLLAMAIAPASRGRALATRALLLVERRLEQDGVARLFARVPRKNGRGLYYMLRCGFTPATDASPRDEGDATWFARRTRRAR